jgi:hypothetical protein
MISFDWQCAPEAEKFLYHLLEDFKHKNSKIAACEKELMQKTSTRLFDWIDHFTIETSPVLDDELKKIGYEQEYAMPTYRVFTHPGAKLPSLLIQEGSSKHPPGLAVKAESVADFLMVRRMERCIEGTILAPMRRALISKENQIAFFCIERRASRSMEPMYQPENILDDYLTCLERLQTRPRDTFEPINRLLEEFIPLLGKDTTAWIFLEVERKYWQLRNVAAQTQKNRQDSAGMGWANHDHHTFRSSRKHFSQLVRLFESLGFHCRERFYAGEQAGWGAQVMENPVCGLVLFLDVDLGPEEIEIDFAHQPLSEKNTLGTVGLWCALHGDSILEAGMHHLEAQFSFDQLKQDLSTLNIEMMDPFSTFSYLKQTFTQGEIWPVDPQRIDWLLKQKLITATQAEQFLQHGAVGSHLENLQRDEGYKGFNKNNVSLIIKKTDPRTFPPSLSA